MLTVTRLRWFSCLLAILFFFARRAVAFASFATHSHHEYLHDDLNAMLKHLPKESNELVKRQLGDLLAGLTEGLTGGSSTRLKACELLEQEADEIRCRRRCRVGTGDSGRVWCPWRSRRDHMAVRRMV